jgi:hypothetical protein
MRVRAWPLLVGLFAPACGTLVAIDRYSLDERAEGGVAGGDGSTANGDGGQLGDANPPNDVLVPDAPTGDGACTSFCCTVTGAKLCEDFDDRDTSLWAKGISGQPTYINTFTPLGSAPFAGQFHRDNGQNNVSMSYDLRGNAVVFDADLDAAYPTLSTGESVEVVGLVGMDASNAALAFGALVFTQSGFGFVECQDANNTVACYNRFGTVSFPAHVKVSIEFKTPAQGGGSFAFQIASPNGSTLRDTLAVVTTNSSVSNVRVRVGLATSIAGSLDAKFDNIVVR